MYSFIYNFQSEWLRKKRSLASWLVITGGVFLPLISTIAALVYPKETIGKYDPKMFWEFLYNSNMQLMAFFLMPMGAILTTSLITQLEHKNNTWKLLHSLPVSYSNIFLTKLVLILIMLVQFFIILNICIWLSGTIPCLLIPSLSYPTVHFPWNYYLNNSLEYFIGLLPVVALQYILGMMFKNFLVPFGVGMSLFVCGLFALKWEYAYTLPYNFTPLHNLQHTGSVIKTPLPLHSIAFIWFGILVLVGFLLYLNKKDKS